VEYRQKDESVSDQMFFDSVNLNCNNLEGDFQLARNEVLYSQSQLLKRSELSEVSAEQLSDLTSCEIKARAFLVTQQEECVSGASKSKSEGKSGRRDRRIGEIITIVNGLEEPKDGDAQTKSKLEYPLDVKRLQGLLSDICGSEEGRSAREAEGKNPFACESRLLDEKINSLKSELGEPQIDFAHLDFWKGLKLPKDRILQLEAQERLLAAKRKAVNQQMRQLVQAEKENEIATGEQVEALLCELRSSGASSEKLGERLEFLECFG